MKEILVVALGVAVLFALLLYATFWYRFTDFYRDCEKVELGMTSSEAESIMQKYISDSGFMIARKGTLWGSGLYIVSNASGNQCNLQIRDGKVTDKNIFFE